MLLTALTALRNSVSQPPKTDRGTTNPSRQPGNFQVGDSVQFCKGMSEAGHGVGGGHGEEGEGHVKKRKVVEEAQVLIGTQGSEFVKTRLARDGPQAVPYIQQHHGLKAKYDESLLFVFLFWLV